MNGFASTLTLKFDFVAGTGDRDTIGNQDRGGHQHLLLRKPGPGNRGGNSHLHVLLGALGGYRANGGPFSSPSDINGATTYAITKPFTHPSCLSENKVPGAAPFGGFGRVSGSVPANGPVTFSARTTAGNHSQ